MARARASKRGQVELKKAGKRAKAPARSAVAAKKVKATPAVAAKKARPLAAAAKKAKPLATPKQAEPAIVATSSLLFSLLRAEEQRAVQLALGGRATLLECSPRARDAVLFAAAASLAPHPVLVASPLAAELFAQASALPGLDVVAFGSFSDPAVVVNNQKRLQRGGRLLVVAEPAQLFNAGLRQAFARTPLSLLGIAAAHACSEHAHELSPAYLSLPEALAAFAAPVLASCTSTSARVIAKITEAIGASPAAVIRAAELELKRGAQVVRAAERKTALFTAILSYGAPGIVLTATSQDADSVFAELSARGVACVRAHAGMAALERSAALSRFAEPGERLVLVTQSPHANASGLAGCSETNQVLTCVAPRPDLRFVLHYQAPLSPEQQFEDLAWLPAGAHSLVLADSSDAVLVQALLTQQRVKPAAVEAMALALAQVPEDRPAYADTLALRAGTSRRSAERVLSAFFDRNLIARDHGQISRRVGPEPLAAEARLLAARFATLRAADSARAELVARYVTSRHADSPATPTTLGAGAERRHIRA